MEMPAELVSQFLPRNRYDQASLKIQPLCSVKYDLDSVLHSANNSWILANMGRIKAQIVLFFETARLDKYRANF